MWVLKYELATGETKYAPCDIRGIEVSNDTRAAAARNGRKLVKLWAGQPNITRVYAELRSNGQTLDTFDIV